MRRAARRDRNEARIVKALESIGVVVYRISQPGLGDLLCWRRQTWCVIEVKMPGEHLTPAQEKVRAVSWYPVVENEREAIALFDVRLP